MPHHQIFDREMILIVSTVLVAGLIINTAKDLKILFSILFWGIGEGPRMKMKKCTENFCTPPRAFFCCGGTENR